LLESALVPQLFALFTDTKVPELAIVLAKSKLTDVPLPLSVTHEGTLQI
jgi:hypothetical protein